MTRPSDHLRKAHARFLWSALFLALALLAIGLVGYGSFTLHRYLVRKAAAEQLAVVSDLKVGQIRAWMDYEKSTALGLSRGMLMSRQLEEWLRTGKANEAEKARCLGSLKVIQEIFGYKDVSLLTIGGQPLLSTTGLTEKVGRYDKWVLANTLLSGKPKLTSIRWDDEAVQSLVHLDVMAPMVAVLAGEEVTVAVLRLRVDPERYLFPLVQKWPIASATAESLLIENQGADVLFLNELRQRKDMALRLRVPMNDPDLLAAQVARGAVDSLIEGRDYLGHKVLGTGRTIPGTQWHLVAKQDQDEIFQELWPRTLWTSLVALGFVGITFLSISFWLRQRVAAQIHAELEGIVEARTDQLQDALVRAQAADRAKLLFLARIGHELFTPLNHMQLYAQLLRDEWSGRTEVKDLDRILASGRALEALIRQLIRYSDLEGDGERAVSKVFSPLVLAQDLANQFQPMAAKGLAFVFEPGEDIPEAWTGDPGRTGEILGELLLNAFKFTNQGQVVFRAGGGRRLFFEVEDTGPGIPEAARDLIFQPLEQVDGSLTRSHGGTGIGLAVAGRLSRIIGGVLSFECPAKGGSRFRLEFPAPGRGEVR